MGGDGALVLFSGGQDSTTCLAWALDRYDRVETVGFAYGQRHAVELECRAPVREGLAALGRADTAPDVMRRPDAEGPDADGPGADGPGADELGVDGPTRDWGARLGPDHVIDLTPTLAGLGATALTSEAEIRMNADGLPSTFVPGRNLLFLTCAAALAYRRGLRRIVGGMCETDFSGYPDCRDDTVKAMQLALNLGLDRRFVLETPLMWRDKAATWEMAERLGGSALVALVVERTHTCYRGDRTHRHDWGWGCGACPACDLRAAGWRRWRSERL